MNIVHLKYAVEVERTGSITQAADNLFMGQPNLSKAIKELEADLGIKIFKRTPKGIIPTNKGAEFLSYARGIISEIDNLEDMYKKKKDKKILFNISVPRASYITHAIVKVINKMDLSKEIEINLNETNSFNAMNNILRGNYPFGIIRYQVDLEPYYLNLFEEKNFKYKDICQFEQVALMSKDSPLAYKDKLEATDLADYIEIIKGDQNAQSMSLPEIKRPEQPGYSGRRIFVYERGSQYDMLCGVPNTYMWASPLPRELLDRYGLVQRRCHREKGVYKDVLIYSNSYKLTELDMQFIDEIMKVKDEVLSYVL